MTFPLYIKSTQSRRWYKVNSTLQYLVVQEMDQITKVNLIDNKMMLGDILNDKKVVPCTRDEFEKAYGEAQWKLTQANNTQ